VFLSTQNGSLKLAEGARDQKNEAKRWQSRAKANTQFLSTGLGRRRARRVSKTPMARNEHEDDNRRRESQEMDAIRTTFCHATFHLYRVRFSKYKLCQSWLKTGQNKKHQELTQAQIIYWKWYMEVLGHYMFAITKRGYRCRPLLRSGWDADMGMTFIKLRMLHERPFIRLSEIYKEITWALSVIGKVASPNFPYLASRLALPHRMETIQRHTEHMNVMDDLQRQASINGLQLDCLKYRPFQEYLVVRGAMRSHVQAEHYRRCVPLIRFWHSYREVLDDREKLASKIWRRCTQELRAMCKVLHKLQPRHNKVKVEVSRRSRDPLSRPGIQQLLQEADEVSGQSARRQSTAVGFSILELEGFGQLMRQQKILALANIAETPHTSDFEKLSLENEWQPAFEDQADASTTRKAPDLPRPSATRARHLDDSLNSAAASESGDAMTVEQDKSNMVDCFLVAKYILAL
jgi:hypothetical protein